MPLTKEAIDYFKKIVATVNTIEPMMKQYMKQHMKHHKYPLKGIEHKFIGKEGGLCKYCSYDLGNINHVELT
jgi:hypothetical protein